MKAFLTIILIGALSGCAYIDKGIDYADQKIVPAGTVIVKSKSLIDLSAEFKAGYVGFREIIREKKDLITPEDYAVLEQANSELVSLGSYVDGLLSSRNSLGNVLLNSDQILDIVTPVDSAVKLGKSVLDNNPEIFSESEAKQYALLNSTWDQAINDVLDIDGTLSESETAGRLMRLGRMGVSLVKLAPLLI